MYPILDYELPPHGGGYVPYFYQRGLHQLYALPTGNQRPTADADLQSAPDSGGLDGLLGGVDRIQTVEDVIQRGYFAVPDTNPITALISDKRHTSRLGLDDVIGQIRHRYELYESNFYEIQLAKCAAINGIYHHEAYRGPGSADSRQHYAKHKAIQDLYAQKRGWNALNALEATSRKLRAACCPKHAQQLSRRRTARVDGAESSRQVTWGMMQRVQELCRRLKPVLGKQSRRLVDRRTSPIRTPAARPTSSRRSSCWRANTSASGYEPDRSPFPPPSREVRPIRRRRPGTGLRTGSARCTRSCSKADASQSTSWSPAVLAPARRISLSYSCRASWPAAFKVVALDWKRGLPRYAFRCSPICASSPSAATVSPFRFNPLIPPPVVANPGTWIKLIVDVIASAYLGGEGVISLLVSGLNHLYTQAGVFDGFPTAMADRH